MSFQPDLPGIPVNAGPMAPISAIMYFNSCNEDYVLSAIDTGVFSFAWDIRGLDAVRREIRGWRESWREWVANGRGHPAGSVTLPDHLAVIESLFPHSRPEMRGTELQRMFCCGHSHIINLIKDGLLTATTEIKTGPNGSPKITRASIIQLLLDRRVL